MEPVARNPVQPRLRFGIWTPQLSPWPVIVQRWLEFEKLGFDSAWVVDHFVNPYHYSGDWFEAWTLLAALATQTTKIRVGTLVTNIIYRNPALLARQALSVDHISKGRLELGIGATSAHDISHAMTGIEVWDKGERAGRFRETIEIIDQMLRQPLTTYEGTYYSVKSAEMHPAAVQRPRPPLTIAAHGPKTLKIAATFGNAWSTLVGDDLSPSEALKVTSQRNQQLTDFALEAGRDPQAIIRSLAVGWTSDLPFASLESFYDFIGRYQEAGINEFVFGYWSRAEHRPEFDKLPHITDDGMLERIAHEAIPKLKSSNIQ